MDNTLTYKDSFGKHNFGAMLGTSMRQETYKNLWGSAPNVPEGNDSICTPIVAQQVLH